jgi:hypothetical protein
MYRIALALAVLLATTAVQADPAASQCPTSPKKIVHRCVMRALAPLLAALAVGPLVSKTVLQDEYGGKIDEHMDRFAALADSGDEVEVRGTCQSACTLILARVPKVRLCFADNAHLDFHQARSIADNSVSLQSTYWMVMQYPPDIRAWVQARGGPAKIPAVGYWVLNAPDLWDMGYKRCD